MAVFAWVMLGLAIWHFAVWVPDRFWGGIVGAFLGGLIGSVASGWLLSGASIPAKDDVDLLNVLFAVPGTIAGLAIVYVIGARRDPRPPVHL